MTPLNLLTSPKWPPSISSLRQNDPPQSPHLPNDPPKSRQLARMTHLNLPTFQNDQNDWVQQFVTWWIRYGAQNGKTYFYGCGLVKCQMFRPPWSEHSTQYRQNRLGDKLPLINHKNRIKIIKGEVCNPACPPCPLWESRACINPTKKEPPSSPSF